jgi:hypothetical protein
MSPEQQIAIYSRVQDRETNDLNTLILKFCTQISFTSRYFCHSNKNALSL